MRESESSDILQRLSVPGRTLPLSRRRFLQLGAAGVGGAAIAPWISNLSAFAAPAVGPEDGIVVLVMLGGGNDGLNTLCPISSGAYYDLRGGLAISPSQALPLKSYAGLHPSLTRLKRHWNRGRVAIVRGVGYEPPDLSHFTSMGIWMQGWGGSGSPSTGWMGRYLDGLPNAERESLYAVTMGSSVPLHLVGARARASGLPADISGAFGIEREDASDIRMYDALASYGRSASGLGALGDLYGRTCSDLMTLTQKIQPAYQGATPDTWIGRQLVLCARLINANLGVRVFNAHLDGFDTHAGQPGSHAQLLAELDQAIDAFFLALDDTWAKRVVLMTFSEFGRRPEANGDNGTDHGTSGLVFLVGDRVRGGLHGEHPSLTDLDDWGNLRTHVDFRSVYATVLSKWLRADDTEVLGRTFEHLDLFRAGPGAPAPTPLPGDSPGGDATQATGYWVTSRSGAVAALGAAARVASLPALSRPIVGGDGTPAGKGMWCCASDGGIFTFGDAKFYGSTGAMRLNQPIVSMAASPTGKGYWLCASDGGIFTFGDAKFYGSAGSLGVRGVHFAPTPTGRGYWLLASDGRVFAFGDAKDYGDASGAAAVLVPTL